MTYILVSRGMWSHVMNPNLGSMHILHNSILVYGNFNDCMTCEEKAMQKYMTQSDCNIIILNVDNKTFVGVCQTPHISVGGWKTNTH